MAGRLRDVWWTAAFLRDVAAGDRPTLFKRLTGRPVVSSHVTSEAGRRPVAYDLYAAPSRRRVRRQALIVTHGFTPGGARDPRMVALCTRLARLGWLVMAPQFPQMRRYQLGLEDTDDLETALCAITQHPDVADARASVLAFSFGVAPVLVGLAREPIRARASFALAFGGCFDLKHAMKYALTGAFDQAGISGRLTLPTEGDDRWKILKGNLDLIPRSPTRSQFSRMVDARIADLSLPVDETTFSHAERVVCRLIENRDPDRFDALYQEAAPFLDNWIRALSPATVASEITTPLVIIHSEIDHKTHYSESVALGRGTPNAPPPLLAIVKLFTHVDVSMSWGSLASFRADVWPSMRQLWAVVFRLVTECRSAARRPRARECGDVLSGQDRAAAAGNDGLGSRARHEKSRPGM